MSFGERLKAARKNKKLTQVEVAERVGIDDTTLSKYENDKSEPDNETLTKLADLYEVSFDWLYGEQSKVTYLTEKEAELIERLRKMPEEKKRIIFEVTRTMENI